jgi:hypothetical protein
MDDRQLQRLLRMAAEAEQLDHPAAGAGRVDRVLAGGGRVSLARPDRSWWRARGVPIGGALAAAACLAVGAFVFLMPQSPVPIAVAPPEHVEPESRGGGSLADLGARAEASGETGRATLAAHRPEEEAVLFAVYRGANGSCECVQVNDPDWGGDKRLAEVSRHELLRAGLQEPCTTLAPEVLVIGVAGKPGTVPSSRQHAETIARRLGDQPLRGRDVASMAYAAMPDLPAGTVIVAEKVSIGP